MMHDEDRKHMYGRLVSIALVSVFGISIASLGLQPASKPAAAPLTVEELTPQLKPLTECQRFHGTENECINIPGATPTDLSNAYKVYALIKSCYDERLGYAAVFISNPEMDKARSAIKRLEQLTELTNEETETLWSAAAERARIEFASRMSGGRYSESATKFNRRGYLCQQEYRKFNALISERLPATGIQKDF